MGAPENDLRKDVLTEPLITYARKQFPDYHQLLKRVLGSKPGSMQIAAECDSGPSLLTAIKSGKGVAVTAAWSVDATGSRLRFIPIAPAPPPAEVCVTLREEPMAPAVKALWLEAQHYFTDHHPA